MVKSLQNDKVLGITRSMGKKNTLIVTALDSKGKVTAAERKFKTYKGNIEFALGGDILSFVNSQSFLLGEKIYPTEITNKGPYDQRERETYRKKAVSEFFGEEEQTEKDKDEEVQVVEEPKKEEEEEVIDWEAPVKHEKYEQIKACIENEIPVMLVGPAGSGKNFTLEQIAWDLEMDFYFTNSVQQEYKITGFIDAGGTYHETEFYKAFKNGGLFFLDEMDASIPEVLVLLNAAIANGYFEFPNGRITANEKFRIVAAGNTVGNGADEQYTGRLVLDQATLDRFAIIEFDYSLMVEMKITKGNKELVDFVRQLRSEASNKGIRATFSYRALEMVTKLEKTEMEMVEIIKITIVKGLDKDTIGTLNPTGYSKYHEALKKVQRAA